MSKVWLITGSSRGLGHALAEAVLARGDSLVATARNPAQLTDLTERHGDRVRTVALDVTDEAAAERAVRAAIDSFGRLDVLVNNAGYGNVNAIEDTSVAEFREQIETNLFGTIIMTKAAIPWMREQRSGHLIQFSSVGGRVGALGRAPYSAAKWGVEGFSESLAKEVGPLGIKVTIVEPGYFDTDFLTSDSLALPDTVSDAYPEIRAMIAAHQAMPGTQLGDPVKAAAAILAIAQRGDGPLRQQLGSDSAGFAAAKAEALAADVAAGRELAVSTDYSR